MAMIVAGIEQSVDVRVQVLAPGGGDDGADGGAEVPVPEPDDTSTMAMGAKAASLVPGHVGQAAEQDEKEKEYGNGDGGEDAGSDADSEIDEFHFDEAWSFASTAEPYSDFNEFSEFSGIVPAQVWWPTARPYWSSASLPEVNTNNTKTKCSCMPNFLGKLRSKIRLPKFRRAKAAGVTQISHRTGRAAF